jgi:acetyltransferase
VDLIPLMKPRSVAVVGASARLNRATRVIANLQRFGYAGRVFPINGKYTEILGLPCYPDLASTPEPADTVVVAIPAADVPAVLADAAARGVRGAVVLSSGFGEAGAGGRARQEALERLAAERGLPICGPNCYGVFNVRLGSATFSADFTEAPRPGAVALVSQSGGFSHAIAEHLMQQRAVGLSYIVSCGNQAGVGVEDYVEFLLDDADTQVVGVFVEGFRRPGKLREIGALARARGTPVVALKVGRSENARQAMLAHTGSLAGTPEIVEALLRQSGIVQVGSLNEMLDTITLLAAARRVTRSTWRTVVVSGLGGECGRVADAADRAGVELPPLSAGAVERIAGFMPDFANPRNPLDGTGAMYEDATLFPRLIDCVVAEEGADVVAVNLRANVPKPGGWAPNRQFARIIGEKLAAGGSDKLILAFSSFAGADLDPEVVRPLAAAGVPFLEGTETAMLALRHLAEHRRFLERPGARRAPGPAAPDGAAPVGPPPRAPARVAVEGAVRAAGAPTPWRRAVDGPGVLANADAMHLLREFGIPLAETIAAATAEAAVAAAEKVGYPAVLKVDSPDVVHKTDVGGVRLGCADAAAVRRAFTEVLAEVRRRAPSARIDGVLVQPMIAGGTEMIAGVKSDPLVGPAVVCGFGGVLVEVMRDVAVRVPPIDAGDARDMLAELRGAALLGGVRGRPAADVAALADVLVRIAALADAYRDRLRALDLNPLVVRDAGGGAVAVDWLIELA